MKPDEAIEILKNMKWSITTKFNAVNNSTKALDLAISALEKQEADRWIPVTEKLPEDGTEVFVYLSDNTSPYIAWICDGHWYTEEFEVEREEEPVAWRPLPEPYEPEEES